MNTLLEVVDMEMYNEFCSGFNRELYKCNGDIKVAIYNMKCKALGDEDGGIRMISYLLGVEHAFRYMDTKILKRKE